MKTYTEQRKAELKAIILDYIANNPGARKRDLGAPCGEWHINLIGIVSELEKEGKIYSVCTCDPANMESYDQYYKSCEVSDEEMKKVFTNYVVRD